MSPNVEPGSPVATGWRRGIGRQTSRTPPRAWCACTAPIRPRSTCPPGRASRAWRCPTWSVRSTPTGRWSNIWRCAGPCSSPRATLSFAQAGASNRVADTERRRLIRHIEEAGLQKSGERWLKRASEQVLAALSDGREAASSELRDEIPLLEGAIAYGEGKSWGGSLPVGPRVLTTLSAAGHIVRASNDGGWTTSRPRWTSTASWLARRSRRFRSPKGSRGWSNDGCTRSAPGRSRTSSGGSGRPWLPHVRRWPISTRSRSTWTARPDTCCPTTWSRPRGRALACAPASIGPDHDGMVRARLVPRLA